MSVQPPLFPPGWDIEPCDTAEPLDPGLTAYLNQLACDGQGRAAGGRRRWVYLDKPIHEITPDRRYL
ncbi:hypothetical protein [Streptomyces goshikiensis]|uniref:hypothetical protein n=1 Tax=Streptomyces goshikiensis TaxID=1942 RepID=UPI002E0F0DD0|nr:hypothetical protein OG224_06845 [Streptomyces goshikiensis]